MRRVSFQFTDEQGAKLDRVRQAHGCKSLADTVRVLLDAADRVKPAKAKKAKAAA